MRITGYDVNGVPRVYGENDTVEAALKACTEEAMDYVRKRPDTGPLDKWLFIDDAKGWIKGRIK
jgi:hypothetical protein